MHCPIDEWCLVVMSKVCVWGWAYCKVVAFCGKRGGLFLGNGVVMICGLVYTSSGICGFEVLFCLIHQYELDIGRIEGLLL